METEIDFANKDGRLIPGMYAEATLSLAKNAQELCVPLEAVARNNNEATVLVVNKNNEIEERKIKLGFEGESYVQVLGGRGGRRSRGHWRAQPIPPRAKSAT